MKAILRLRSHVGRVHSVFSRAFNVETPEGEVFSVLVGGTRYWLAINVQPWPGQLRVRKGMVVTYGDSKMAIPDAGISILLKGSLVWRTTTLEVRLGARHDVLQALRIAAAIGCRFGNLQGFGGLLRHFCSEGSTPSAGAEVPFWLGRGYRAAEDLLMALRRRDPWCAEKAARELVGLGPGLTPAGDDLLAGLIGGWWWRKKAYGGHGGLPQHCLRTVAAVARECTNVFGYREIYGATVGELPEAALEVVTAILRGNIELASRVLELLALGSSSGTDMLAGICLALASVEDLVS